MRLRTRRHSEGFTLAELLVASTMLAVVLGTVYTSFSSSVNLWKIGEADIAAYQDARIALDILTRELQNMVPGAAHLFAGSEDEFEYYAVTRPMNVEDGADPRVLQIRYRVKSDPHGEGKLLIREESPVEGPFPSRPPRDGVIEDTDIDLGSESQFELAAGVKKFDLHYYYLQPADDAGLLGAPAEAPAEFDIREELDTTAGLPQAIRIDLTMFDPNAEDGETRFSTYAVLRTPAAPPKDAALGAIPVGPQ